MTPKRVPMQEENKIFNYLRKEVKKKVPMEWEKVKWVSE